MWWKGSPGQEGFMLSAPIRVLAVFAIAIASRCLTSSPCRAQISENLSSGNNAMSATGNVIDSTDDPVDRELLDLGHVGATIQRTRIAVMAILSEQNSCSAWFRAAEPEAAAKFRSLRFVVDSAGPGEITRLREGFDSIVILHPYVARTGQNVGWGSTIMLNANGAFFREIARVRTLHTPSDFTYDNTFRSLVVGNFSGASPAARILTVLHELGHVLDLLPVDSGVPAGPLLSMRNTSAVLDHCGSQIRAHSKRFQKSEGTKMVASTYAAAGHTSSQPGVARTDYLSHGVQLVDFTSGPASISNSLEGAPPPLAAARRMRSDMFLPAPLP